MQKLKIIHRKCRYILRKTVRKKRTFDSFERHLLKFGCKVTLQEYEQMSLIPQPSEHVFHLTYKFSGLWSQKTIKNVCEQKRSLFSHRLNTSTDSNLLLLSSNLFTKGCSLCFYFEPQRLFFYYMNEHSLHCSDGLAWLYRHLSSLRREFE